MRGGIIRGGRGGSGLPFIRGRGNMRGAMGPSPWATNQGPQSWGGPWNQGMAMQNPLMGGGMGGMNQMGGGMGMGGGMVMGGGMGMGGGWGNNQGMGGGMNQLGGKIIIIFG